ncbi:hypothetical protein VNO77_18846 [Canavalia gladiata]|uniref:Uncharacterized protein n=1 Tax=Canavalia gladiata TaxID=3824 RepID=A0AAN9LQG6_CANGL
MTRLHSPRYDWNTGSPFGVKPSSRNLRTSISSSLCLYAILETDLSMPSNFLECAVLQLNPLEEAGGVQVQSVQAQRNCEPIMAIPSRTEDVRLYNYMRQHGYYDASQSDVEAENDLLGSELSSYKKCFK